MNLFRYKQQRRALSLEQIKRQLEGRLIAAQMHAGKAAQAVERNNYSAFVDALEAADNLTPKGF